MKIVSFLASASLFVAALLPVSAARADVAPTCNQFDSAKSCDQASLGKTCDDGKTCYEVNCEAASGGADKIYKCLTCPTKIDDPGKVCDAGFSAFGKACGDSGTCSKQAGYCPDAGTFGCYIDKQNGAGGSSGAGGSGQSGSAGSEAGGSAGAAGGSAGSAGSAQAGSGGSAGSSAAGSSAAGSSAAGSSAAGSSAAGSSSGESKSDDDSGCTVATAGARRQGALAGLMLALGAAALLADRRKRR